MKNSATLLTLLGLVACSGQAMDCPVADQNLTECPPPRAPLVPEIRGASGLRAGHVVVELTVKADVALLKLASLLHLVIPHGRNQYFELLGSGATNRQEIVP